MIPYAPDFKVLEYGKKRLWPKEAHSESGIVLDKNRSGNANFGLENALTYAIWNVKEI